jgi:hypothetical protein
MSKGLLFIENSLNRIADMVSTDNLPRVIFHFWNLFLEEFCKKYLDSMFETQVLLVSIANFKI